MIRKPNRKIAREKRHYKLRNFLSGTTEKPRLAVYRSNMHMYVQLIDDVKQVTIAQASTLDKEVKSQLEKTNDVNAATVVGKVVATRALAKGIDTVVFDRGGYKYHGKVKAVAEAAREAGLKF